MSRQQAVLGALAQSTDLLHECLHHLGFVLVLQSKGFVLNHLDGAVRAVTLNAKTKPRHARAVTGSLWAPASASSAPPSWRVPASPALASLRQQRPSAAALLFTRDQFLAFVGVYALSATCGSRLEKLREFFNADRGAAFRGGTAGGEPLSLPACMRISRTSSDIPGLQ